MNQKSILLVEDDDSLSRAIESFMVKQNDVYIKSVSNIDHAKQELDRNDYQIVLSDVKMSIGNGYDLIEYLKSNRKNALVILMTAYGNIEQAVTAMKNGAYDFIVKPFQLTTLEHVVRAAFEDYEKINMINLSQSTHASDQMTLTQKRLDKKIFISNNPIMKGLIDNLHKVAASKATVLIQGESGTGKEVLANMIHNFSHRRDKPFIAINCAALPDNLLESELFGHEKGSFTGAIQRQIGKFELSDGGTILLDEISEMSMNMQTKLLRVLQECEVYRIGGNKAVPLNLRVITSTNRDLYSYMKAGNFREDLYYRINVIPIVVPPLRDRGDDVITLANYFLDEFAQLHDRPRIQLDELARYKILNHSWQGNVRELKNSMERAVLVGNFDQIINEDVAFNVNVNSAAQNLSSQHSFMEIFNSNEDMTLSEIEKRVIFETLRRCNGNRTKTAEILGISLRTLRNKLKAFRMEENHHPES